MPSVRHALWILFLLCFCVRLSIANNHLPRQTNQDAAISPTPIPSSNQTANATKDGAAAATSGSTQLPSNSTPVSAAANTLLPSAVANATIADGVLPLQSSITPGLGIGGVVLILSGLAYAFIGIKNRRVQIGLSAGYLGSLSVTVLILYVMVLPVTWAVQGAYVVAIIITGLIVGGFSIVFSDLTEGFGCLFGGFSFAMWVLVLEPGGLLTSTIPIVIFIVSLTVGTYATSFSHYTRPYGLMVSASFGGGTAVIIGVDCFTQAGLKEFWAYIWNLNPNMFPPGTTTYPLTKALKIEIASIIIIFLIGLIVQSRIWKVIKKRREKRAALAETYGRETTLEEELVGRRIEFINKRERAKWEAIYGDKTKVSESSDSGVGVGVMDSTSKESFNNTAFANHSDSIELSELPDTPMPRTGLMGRAKDSTVMVTVLEDDEPEPDEEPEHNSQRENLPEVATEDNEVAEGFIQQKDESLGPKSAKPSDDEIRERIRGAVVASQNSSHEPAPEVVPLPFKIPYIEGDDDRSSFATVDDDEIGTLPSRHASRKGDRLRSVFSGSEKELEEISRRSSAASIQRISFHARTDRFSTMANRDDLTDDDSGRSLLQISPPRSPTATQFEGEEALHLAEQKVSSDEVNGELREETGAKSSPVSTLPSETEDRKVKSSALPTPSLHHETSVSSKSVRVSLAERNLPASISKVATSYRTNEWAKHLSNADVPEFEELPVSKSTSHVSVGPAAEKIAAVNMDELTQTPETGTVLPAPARATLRPQRSSTIQLPNITSNSGSLPQLSHRSPSRLTRISSAPSMGPTVIESPHEESPPTVWRANSYLMRGSVAPPTLFESPYEEPSPPPVRRTNSNLARASAASPTMNRQTSGFSENPSRAGALSPDIWLADDNMALSARRNILMHTNSFSSQPIEPQYRGSSSPTQFRGSPSPTPFRGSPSPIPFRGSPSPIPFRGSSSPTQFSSQFPTPFPATLPAAFSNQFRSTPSPTNDRQSAALRASVWRASMQAQQANTDDQVIEERRKMLIKEKAEQEEERRREADESRRVEWERDERRRREGGEMAQRHKEAMRRLQGVANQGLRGPEAVWCCHAATSLYLQHLFAQRAPISKDKSTASCSIVSTAAASSILPPRPPRLPARHRHRGSQDQVVATASHASRAAAGASETAGQSSASPTSSQAQQQLFPSPNNDREPPATATPDIFTPGFQPAYPPVVSLPSSTSRWSLRNALGPLNAPLGLRQPHIYPRTSSRRRAHPIAQSNAPRLWNPLNSTPRSPPRSSEPILPAEVVAVPLQHPQIGDTHQTGIADGSGGKYPLLSLKEQRASRHSETSRASLHVEHSSSGSNRVSLPRSVSFDKRRSRDAENLEGKEEAATKSKTSGDPKRSQSISGPSESLKQHKRLDSKGKGKQRAVMDEPDLERGLHRTSSDPYPAGENASNTSLSGRIGPALSNSSASSIHGDGPADDSTEWGPLHPCYPHLNPHVPLSSPLYANTRIIRIRRDWMLEGDLAPTFSPMYPEVLSDAGLQEGDFRLLIDEVNKRLVPAFSSFEWRNVMDGFLGFITGWVWDDLGVTAVKGRLREVENVIDQWNGRAERDGWGARFVGLRRTAYMSLDIQIPTPEIGLVESENGEGEAAQPE